MIHAVWAFAAPSNSTHIPGNVSLIHSFFSSELSHFAQLIAEDYRIHIILDRVGRYHRIPNIIILMVQDVVFIQFQILRIIFKQIVFQTIDRKLSAVFFLQWFLMKGLKFLSDHHMVTNRLRFRSRFPRDCFRHWKRFLFFFPTAPERNPERTEHQCKFFVLSDSSLLLYFTSLVFTGGIQKNHIE